MKVCYSPGFLFAATPVGGCSPAGGTPVNIVVIPQIQFFIGCHVFKPTSQIPSLTFTETTNN